MSASLRVGIVNYLNSRPLAWSFLQGQAEKGLQPLLLPPSRVADALAAGDLDVGLIPSIEVQRIPDLKVLPGLCVAATREVRSVLLLSRRPFTEIEFLALDDNSRTSAALVRIVLREVFGVDPHCTSVRPDVEDMMAHADAALIIGDPALAVDRSGLRVLDLAAEWRRLTGRPFVFALWAVRNSVDLGARQDAFHRSLQHGLAEMEQIVCQAAAEMGLDREAVRQYLTRCLSFELGASELQGLGEFYRRAVTHGLLDRADTLDMATCCDPDADSVE